MIRHYILVALVLSMALTGCGGDGQTAHEPTDMQIGVAYALGGKGDMTYNDAAERGTVALRNQGYDLAEFEPATLDDYAKGIDLLAGGNKDLIFCIGFLYDDAVRRVAPGHPDTVFVVLDGTITSGSNVASIQFNAEEGSFLAGVAAAKISETNRLGFVGGADIAPIREFLDGYEKGAKSVAPDIDVLIGFTGSGGTSFTDPVKGREVAAGLIRQGADVLYHAAGSSGNGVIRAAEEAGVYAIGVDVDQRPLAPDTVVASMVKNFDSAMLYVINLIERDALPSTSLELGLEEDAVELVINERFANRLGELPR